ncbi:hypothetical protein GC174_16390 [bacterium]|nr:hypothetical protein [bacterium]
MAKRRRVRIAFGIHLIEMAVSMAFLMVLVLMSVDIGVILYGAFLNDRACRVAVRAAAQGKDAAEATALAGRTVLTIKSPDSWIKSPKLILPITYEDFGGNYAADNSPFVTVSTETEVDLPVPINFAGNSFMPSGRTTFKQTYTFPVIRAR